MLLSKYCVTVKVSFFFPGSMLWVRDYIDTFPPNTLQEGQSNSHRWKNTEAKAADTEAARKQKIPQWEKASQMLQGSVKDQYVNQTRTRRATDLRWRSPAGITVSPRVYFAACSPSLQIIYFQIRNYKTAVKSWFLSAIQVWMILLATLRHIYCPFSLNLISAILLLCNKRHCVSLIHTHKYTHPHTQHCIGRVLVLTMQTGYGLINTSWLIGWRLMCMNTHTRCLHVSLHWTGL